MDTCLNLILKKIYTFCIYSMKETFHEQNEGL